jgi:hypothetical protein
MAPYPPEGRNRSARSVPPPIVLPERVAAMRVVADRLASTRVTWALTGSLGLALRGVPVFVHDVDVQTDRDGAYEIERIFADRVDRPVRFSESARVRSHLGTLRVDGVVVEIMGDVQHHLPSGDWEPPPALPRLLEYIDVSGRRIPVLPLEHEADAYAKLGRADRAAQIAAFRERRPEA